MPALLEKEGYHGYHAEREKSPTEKIAEIKEKNVSKDIKYNIVYDSVAESVEPIYFWLLDFLEDNEPSGLGMDEVIKNKDEFEAAVGSGYFSDLGVKATRMQDQAMKMMATINTVVRSIINLIYDLREFEIRLEIYDDLNSADEAKRDAAELSLRVIWMDQVDIKRGRGSINMLAQQLQFVTLRDSFLYAKDEKEVDNIDLNDRVKRILKSRLNEYLKWKNYSERELRKRYSIEKAYLKSQWNSLQHYTTWVKPYLIAAKKLNMSTFLTESGMPSPNIVNIFNNMELRLTLLGMKEIKPEDLSVELANIKLDNKYYACIEVEIIFRTVPRATQSQQGLVYVHSGRTDVNIIPYSFSDKDLESLKGYQREEDLDLIEGMVQVSIKELQEDIDKYTKKEPSLDEKLNYLKNLLKSIRDKSARRQIEGEIRNLELGKKGKVWRGESPFRGIFSGFRQALMPLKYIKDIFKFKVTADQTYYDKIMREAARKKAEALSYVLYDVYKKSHGMITW